MTGVGSNNLSMPQGPMHQVLASVLVHAGVVAVERRARPHTGRTRSESVVVRPPVDAVAPLGADRATLSAARSGWK